MITLHDWSDEQRNLLTEFEQWWQENHARSSVSFQLCWTQAIGLNSSRSSLTSKKAPLESVRGG